MTPMLADALYLTAHDYWVMATAIVGNVACALLGCFLVLRRLSLLGDAISHAVLPGLAAAFIITGARDPLTMMAGALAAGVLTAAMSAGLARGPRVTEDSALGVVFTGMFALGVLMITWVARDVDLDPGCVLYGVIETTTSDTVRIVGVEVPRALAWLSIILAVNLGATSLFYKELKIVAFDPQLATAMGINAALVHYGLMTLVAGTTVAAFESVGSILVVTMLVAPAASAHLLTDRLPRMIVWSIALAGVAGVLGYLSAVWLNTSVAGMMSVVAGLQFAAAALFAPRHGYLARQIRRSLLAIEIAGEDLLADLYRRQEGAEGRAAALQSGFARAIARRRARAAGWIGGPASDTRLTAAGLERARQVVRSHRLWESFLSEKLGLPGDHVHDPSERVEHYIGPAMREALHRDLGRSTDPHGREIPPGA